MLRRVNQYIAIRDLRQWIRDERNYALELLDLYSEQRYTSRFVHSIILVTRKRILNRMLYIFDKISRREYDYVQLLPQLNKMVKLHCTQFKREGDPEYPEQKRRLKNIMRIIYDFAFRPSFQAVRPHS